MSGEIKAIPRNRYMGMLADGLRKAQDSTGIVGDFLLGDAPRTLDQWSYGFSPVRMGRTDQGLAGAVYGMKVDPGIMDVAGVAGMAPAAGRGAAWAGREALGQINDAMLGGGNHMLARALSGISPRHAAPTPARSSPRATWSKSSDEVFDPEGNVIGADDYNLIELVYVPPEMRGRGEARRVLNETIQEIQKDNSNPIRLAAYPTEPDVDMERLVKFYEKEGFNIIDTSGHAVIMEY